MGQKPTEEKPDKSDHDEGNGLSDRSRRLIQTLGAVGAIGTAGCFDDGDTTLQPGGGNETTSPPGGGGTETTSPPGDGGTETPSPPDGGDTAVFEVSDLTPADATVTQGDLVDVSATVTNTGDADGERDVDMVIDGNVVATESLALTAGADQTVSFADVDTVSLTPGEHTHTVDTGDDQVSGTLTVEEPVAVFEVSDLDPTDATVTQGDVIDVSATVENTGNSSGSKEIDLLIGGNVVATQSLSVDSGATQTLTFADVDTRSLDVGAYTHTVDTGDDQISGTLTVEADDTGESGPATQWQRDMDVPVNPDAATNWDNYEVTKVLSQGDFMDLKVAPDGRLFYITRGQNAVGTGGGKSSFYVAYFNPDTGEETTVLEKATRNGTSGSSAIDTNSRETGGQSIAFDPNFEENDRIYVLYHPQFDDMDDIGGSPYDQFWDGEVERFGYMLLSRFEFSGEEIDPDSETEILRIPQQYDSCCHHGANLEFGPEGNLYVSVGDNSEIVSPYSSMDDRESQHPGYDAGRSSSNTADVRGSILRIRPTEEGGNGPDTVENPNGLYEIPEGNLKEVHEERMGEEYSVDEFRPEIFSMGYRNPYVISADDYTGSLFTATYGPGYGSWADSPERGPPGICGYRLISEADYAGWPYFQGYYPYRRYDHDTGEVGQPYWIDRPHNDSRNNTGLERLPPFEPDMIWQSQNGQTTLDHYHPPAWADMPRPGEVTYKDPLEGSGGNCAGPAYRYSEEYGETALPPFFEGKQFFMTSCAAKPATWYVTFHEDGTIDIDQFLPDAPWVGGDPHHMAFDPSGRLFVSNYGDGFYMVEYQGPQPEYQPPPEEDQPDRVEPGAEGLSTDPPGDATMLWDGEDATLEDWEPYDDASSVQDWGETADYFETPSDTSYIQSADELGDVHLHVEWRAPESANAEQPWANSGVFMMQRYEIQVLNDRNDPTATWPSGSYYSQQKGLVNAVRPPGEWNTYDIVWRTPKWEDGELVRPAQFTLFCNGVVVISQLDVKGPNAPDFGGSYGEHPEELPVRLQGYGAADDPIQYRNIWYRDLPAESTYQEVGSAVTESHPESLYGTDEYTIDPGGPGTTGEPPADAEVLIDSGLNGWETPSGDDPDWLETGEYVEVVPGAGDIQTATDYGDAQLHLEYRIPDDVEGEGPFRGASGVLMMGKYEVQILDTWENPVEADEWAGAYTHQNGPHNDAVRQPGEWQQLDIVWRAPRFEGDEVVEPAQLTAFLNGVAVQTRLVVDGINDGFSLRSYLSHAEQPLRLRDEGSEVQFRNTWIRPFETGDLVGEAPEEKSRFPYALDAGGVETEGNVEIDGLQFARAPDGEFVSVTGEPGSPAGLSDLPAPEELEYEGTDNDLLYASEISGEDWSLVADVPEGVYDVTLHFSEWPYFEDDAVPRLQNVSIEDDLVLERFECLRGQAQVETFEKVEVTDGELNIDFEAHPDSVDPYAKLNGLEIDKVEEVSVPYGLDAGGVMSDGDVTIDGLTFDASPDDNQYVSATGQAVAPENPAQYEWEGTDNDLLYATEMSDPEFGIDIGIEDGTYEVTLHFSDWPYFELGENDRVQDVYIEDELVLDAFLCEPGVAQPKTFEVTVTDGELNIDLAVHPDSIDPNAKINGIEIREATDDGSGGGGGDSPEADIELAARSNSAWTGVAPADVEGVDNPTLTLTAGEEYTLEWTNENGAFHNFVIETADGSTPVETELMGEAGSTQSVTFTATEGMTTYYCEPHQTLGMGGSIEIV
jgi:plastocyanin